MKFGLGQSAPRVEDQRLLTGGGRYTDDHTEAAQLRAVVLRSPYPHAQITSINTESALALDGVVAVLTHAELAADNIGHLPCFAPTLVPLTRPDGQPIYVPDYPALANDIVHYAGQPVAFVVAQSLAIARDAAELVEVDYQPLDACTSTADAREANAATVWPQCPDNICFDIQMGDREAVNTALESADHVTHLQIPVSRICTNSMEPRGAVASYDRFEDRYTLISGHQSPHDLRHFLATEIFHVAESQVRVVSPDMGGAFGMRASIFPELVLTLWASKRLDQPVKWLGERSEMIVAEDQSRDMIIDLALALNKDGEFLALDVKSVAACGAYLSYFSPLPTFGNMGGVAGVYTTPSIHVDVTGVFTHTTPICPYRGAGRPEASLAIEQIIDVAAREMGLDRIELRRRNMIGVDAMPFQTGLTFKYDCGEFEANMDSALQAADFAGFKTRQSQARANGRLLGLGVINTIEQSAGLLDEGAEIRFDAGGSATVYMGVHSHGQGHETVFRQLLADRLGLDFERIRYVMGDTDQVPYGHGTGGSRSSGLGGAALAKASDMIIEKGRRVAAVELEAAPQDIEFDQGSFQIAGTDRSISIDDVINIVFDPKRRPADEDGGLSAFATYKPSGPTFPNGCHVCEVEIDPESGVTEMIRYVVVQDCGTIMNPRLLRGQLQGGIVQGLGQIMMERVVFDESGQQLSGSFMDYCMPRADDVPFCEIEFNAVPTATNPLGIKGAGEAGTVGGMPAVMTAVLDALAAAGVSDIEMPASPERVWRALQSVPNAA